MFRLIAGRLHRSEKGQDYVEFAVIVPILMLLIMGIVDFGRVLNVYLVVTHGAREGARIAAIGEDNTAVFQRIDDTTAGITVVPDIDPWDRTGYAAGQPVTVTLASTVELLSQAIAGFLGVADTYTVTSEAVMRYEGGFVE